MKINIIKKLINDDNCYARIVALYACQGKTNVPIEIIEKGLNDDNWEVQIAALCTCQNKNIPSDIFEIFFNNYNKHIRILILNTFKDNKYIPLNIIEIGINDKNWGVRAAAFNACQGKKEIPLDIIKKGLNDVVPNVRAAAMNACKGKNIPIDIIEKGLNDNNYRVITAAMDVCQINRKNIPLIRTFEPPKKVYKKCLKDIIIVAEIPKTAHVRGGYNKQCRASEAIIVDVIGDIYGEKIGISYNNNNYTIYKIGDKVIINDFDYSNKVCSTGYSFLCTKEEAES
jgi:hypothetical protein